MMDEVFEVQDFEVGKAQLLVEAESDILFIGYGNGVGRAYHTMQHLGFDVALLDLRFVKPLDVELLRKLSQKHKRWFVFSDGAKLGGVASALAELGLDVEITSFEYEDSFIPHGKVVDVERALGLLPEQLAKRVEEIVD